MTPQKSSHHAESPILSGFSIQTDADPSHRSFREFTSPRGMSMPGAQGMEAFSALLNPQLPWDINLLDQLVTVMYQGTPQQAYSLKILLNIDLGPLLFTSLVCFGGSGSDRCPNLINRFNIVTFLLHIFTPRHLYCSLWQIAQAQKVLTEMQGMPGAWTRVDAVLTGTDNQMSKYFALQVCSLFSTFAPGSVIRTRKLFFPCRFWITPSSFSGEPCHESNVRESRTSWLT